jgi:transcriptional regulator with XRE-family HTH domain
MATIIIPARSAEAERLRARRTAARLTQRQLAAAAGCSLTTLSNLEAGCIPARSEALDHVLAVLDAAENEVEPGGQTGLNEKGVQAPDHAGS